MIIQIALGIILAYFLGYVVFILLAIFIGFIISLFE